MEVTVVGSIDSSGEGERSDGQTFSSPVGLRSQSQAVLPKARWVKPGGEARAGSGVEPEGKARLAPQAWRRGLGLKAC